METRERYALGAGPGWVVPDGPGDRRRADRSSTPSGPARRIASTVVLAPFVVSMLTSPRETALVGAVAVLPPCSAPCGTTTSARSTTSSGSASWSSAAPSPSPARAAARAWPATAYASRCSAASRRPPSDGAGVDDTLEKLSDILVPAIADVCAIDLLRDGKTRAPRRGRTRAGRRRDRRRAARARGRARRGTSGTGAETLIRDYQDTTLREAALDDDDLDFLRSLDIRTGMTVPLRARGRRIGTLALAMTSAVGPRLRRGGPRLRPCAQRARRAGARQRRALLGGRDARGPPGRRARQPRRGGHDAGPHRRRGLRQRRRRALARLRLARRRCWRPRREQIADAYDSFRRTARRCASSDLPGRRVLAGEQPGAARAADDQPRDRRGALARDQGDRACATPTAACSWPST